MIIRILLAKTPDRALPWRSPLVIARADDQLVKYSRRDGWTCDCDVEGEACPHVDAIADLIDDRVFAESVPPSNARVPSRSCR